MTRKRGSPSPLFQDDGEAIHERQSKRRRVAEPARKRVTKACSSCRRLKEKCDGNSPCSRCLRYRRPCENGGVASESLTSTATNQKELSERLVYLDAVANHFLGDASTDTKSLKRAAERLKYRSADRIDACSSETGTSLNPTTTDTARCTSQDKLSDVAFANKLHEEVQRRLKQAELNLDIRPPSNPAISPLLSVAERLPREKLPPKDVVVFLVGIYLDFAQTTTFLVEKPWIDDKLERLYSLANPLGPEDHPWLCSVLMVCAIGVQYAHLANFLPRENTDPFQSNQDMKCDHDTSLQLYHLATELLSDVLLLPCTDSMQALLLLAEFALSNDESSQACTYIGAAIRIAARMNAPNIDHGPSLDKDDRRTFDRLHQIVRAWDTRLYILIGILRPNHDDISHLRALRLHTADVEQQQISLEASSALFVQLTNWMMAIAQSVSSLHSHRGDFESQPLESLMEARSNYKKWWSDLNISRIPILQLNRRTAPLHICYHLNMILTGRSFAFKPVQSPIASGSCAQTHNALAELVDEAEYSAYEIIDICTMLDRSTGLNGASYIEANACQAAVHVMLAQSLIGRCHLFRGKLDEGMNLLCKMAQNAPAWEPGLSKIDTINNAIDKLAPHKTNQKYETVLVSPTDADNAYRSFQDWAKVGSKRPVNVADLNDREDEGGMDELRGIFDYELIDPTLFAFDPVGFGGLDEGTIAY